MYNYLIYIRVMYKNPMFLFFCVVRPSGAGREQHGRKYQSRRIFQRQNQHKNNSFCRYFLKICLTTDSDNSMLYIHIFQALHSTQKLQFNQASESIFHLINSNNVIIISSWIWKRRLLKSEVSGSAETQRYCCFRLCVSFLASDLIRLCDALYDSGTGEFFCFF